MANTFTRLGGLGVLAGAALACVLAATVVAQAPAGRTVRDGVFTQEQADRGRRVFRSICMNCHEIEEFTGPESYLEEMNGKTVWEAFEFISTMMPDDEPASLELREYAAVIAYALRVSGQPAGESELPLERAILDEIRFVPAATPGG